MKKIIKIVSIAAAIFAMALVCHSYFHVKGTEIDGIARVADTTGIVIKKSYLGITDERKFVLNEVQKEMQKCWKSIYIFK